MAYGLELKVTKEEHDREIKKFYNDECDYASADNLIDLRGYFLCATLPTTTR